MGIRKVTYAKTASSSEPVCLKRWTCITFFFIWAVSCFTETVFGGDVPTPSGVLRLTRDWRAAKADAINVNDLSAQAGKAIDMDRLEVRKGKVPQAEDDMVFWRSFNTPSEWKGKRVWLAYDPYRLAPAKPSDFRLNGHPLPLRSDAVSIKERKTNPSDAPASEDKPRRSWFVEIGSLLHTDKPNVLSFKTGAGMPGMNSGFLLYCRPSKEKVLFLQSEDLSERERELVRQYANEVEKHFNVTVLREVRTFSHASILRDHLKRAYTQDRISGAVLIGTHPVPRFDFGREQGLHPRFYEDLDATWDDTNGDGLLDKMAIDAGFGSEIWTSYIRKMPAQPESLAAFLEKTLAYFRGQLYFPDDRRVLPHVFVGDPGLDHVDLFMKPGYLASYGSHGGWIHTKGPCRYVSPENTAGFYPGSLVVAICGCHSGNVSTAKIKSPDAFLFGRSNALVAFAGARSGGGGPMYPVLGVQDELIRIVPNLGTYYMFMIDMGGVTHSNYTATAVWMFGNPFVDADRIKPSRGASISGKVLVSAPREVAFDTFYVSAFRGNKCYGRARVDANRQYKIECLPPGNYAMTLNTNPVEQETRRLTLQAGQDTKLDWHLPRLWTVHGKILDIHGRPERNGWIELASTSEPASFEKNQLYGIRTDSAGEFTFHGQNDKTVWLRARSERSWQSKPQELLVSSKTDLSNLIVRLQPKKLKKPRRSLGLATLQDCVKKVVCNAPSSEDFPPELDITQVFVGLVSTESKTVPVLMKTAQGRHKTEGQTPHQLRLGLRLAQPLKMTGSEKKQVYIWQMKGKEDTVEVVIFFYEQRGTWLAQVRMKDKGKLPFWKDVLVRVADNWVFVDLVPTAASDQLDVQLSAYTKEGRGRWAIQDHVPTTTSQYHLKANFSDTPSLTVK